MLEGSVRRSGNRVRVTAQLVKAADGDPAFEWLDRAYDVHDPGLSYVKYDPLLRGLRDDQRYHALLTRMNFPVE